MAAAIFNQTMSIGEVIDKDPRTRVVIEKYFGNGCFTCSGFRMESISFGAMMHGMDAEVVVRDLNEIVASVA